MRKLVIATAILGLTALGTACTPKQSSAGTAGLVRGGTFNTTVSVDPGNLDPDQTVISSALLIDSYTYDSLVYVEPDGKLAPFVATRWNVTPNSVTFTIRKDVTCADGGKITASVVKQNIDYIKDPKAKSPFLGIAMPDANYTVDADNAAGTVKVTTKQPYSFLALGAGGLPIICPKGLANRSLLAKGSEGSGPFVLKSVLPNESYTLEARPGYDWGPDGYRTSLPGVPAKVVFRVTTNESTGANLLTSGALNGLVISGADRERLDAQRFHAIVFPFSPLFVLPNQHPGHPASDARVRSALAEALDLNQIGKVATGGLGLKPTGLVTIEPKPCQGDTVSGNRPAYDPSSAAGLLDAAGWHLVNGARQKNGVKLTINLILSSELSSDVAAATELVQDSWRKLGIHVSVKRMPDAEFAQSLFTQPDTWDMAFGQLGVSLPSQLLAFFSGSAQTNFMDLHDDVYDSKTKVALQTPGPAGCALWNQAEESLIKKAEVIPVVEATSAAFAYKATFRILGGNIDPFSIRLTK